MSDKGCRVRYNLITRALLPVTCVTTSPGGRPFHFCRRASVHCSHGRFSRSIVVSLHSKLRSWIITVIRRFYSFKLYTEEAFALIGLNSLEWIKLAYRRLTAPSRDYNDLILWKWNVKTWLLLEFGFWGYDLNIWLSYLKVLKFESSSACSRDLFGAIRAIESL